MTGADEGRRGQGSQLQLASAAGERFTARVRTFLFTGLFMVELVKDAFQLSAGPGRPVTLAFMGLAVMYTVAAEVLARRRYTVALSYVTSALDVVLVSIFIVTLDASQGWGTASKLPVSFLYFALIPLAGMRLLPALPMFVGILSGLAYLSLLVPIAVFAPDRLTGFETFNDVSMPVVSPLRMATGAAFMIMAGILTATLVRRALRAITGVQTLTFLFADLREYTAFVERRGDHAAAELLQDYRTLVRAEVRRTGGGEIKTEGDSFYVIFPTARQALNCAVGILRAADHHSPPINIGIGVHSGDSIYEGGQYVGSAVNLAARLGQQAGSGELLTSEVVRGLLRTSGSPAMSQREDVALKGISDAPRVYAVKWRDLAPDTGSLG